MKKYELTYLISSELSEDEARAFQDKIASFVQDRNGLLGDISIPSRKKLAYPVSKQSMAYMAVFNFQLGPEAVIELEKTLKEDPKILRHLLVIKPKIKDKPIREKKIKDKPSLAQKETSKEKKVELKEIEQKLEEILNEPE